VLKYYIISTCIVLSIAVFATAWNNRELIKILIAPTTLPAAPKPQATDAPSNRIDVPLRGDAPWALSALPDCLNEATVSRGTLAYVHSKMPTGANEIAAGTTLHYGPCTISFTGDEAVVTRGEDRLRIPPHLKLYKAGTTLVLLRTTGPTGELRTYTLPRN
jgi:hypothetical protein